MFENFEASLQSYIAVDFLLSTQRTLFYEGSNYRFSNGSTLLRIFKMIGDQLGFVSLTSNHFILSLIFKRLRRKFCA